jgi:nitrogen regulation protein NR(I)
MNPTEEAKVLLIEDSPSTAAAVEAALRDEGFAVDHADRGDLGLERALKGDYVLVISDVMLPGCDGLEVLKQIREQRPALPLILMTAFGNAETAIRATQLGAYDYLVKPFSLDDLLLLIHKVLARERQDPCAGVEEAATQAGLIGRSPKMQAVYKEIGRVASLPITVLVTGETGTGKEMVARAIHEHGIRRKGPFVAINCAAIPEQLLESELFGHEKGAFTGAHSRRAGRFEQAQGGTLFMDEIGDMTLSTQVKLLRVLQEKSFTRVGGHETLAADVRVIAATHRDLLEMIGTGQFREDLYYRLNVATVSLPALRERAADIPELAAHFLRKCSADTGVSPGITPAAIQYLQTQPWPGNVRQLENVVRKAALLAGNYTIDAEDVRAATAGGIPGVEPKESPLEKGLLAVMEKMSKGGGTGYAMALVELDRFLLPKAMSLAQGNQGRLSEWLGLSRPTLREKLRQIGVLPQASKTE